MALISPRAQFRGLITVPLEFADPSVLMVAQALRQLQARSLRHPIEIASVTANYSMSDIDLIILADATAGDVTISLLSAVGRYGRRVIVKKIDASVNLVIIDPSGTETIDGSSTISLTQRYAMREMLSDNANWQLIGAIGNATAL